MEGLEQQQPVLSSVALIAQTRRGDQKQAL
jgi:hypothetical protein